MIPTVTSECFTHGFRWCLCLYIFTWLGPLTVNADEPPALAKAFEQADALIADGRAGEALDLLREAREQLPPQRRLSTWEADYSSLVCDAALTGGQQAYLIFGDRPRYFSRLPLYQPDGRPVINDADFGYDFNTLILCLDMKSGKWVWSRQTAGRLNWAVHPQTGDVYLWRKKLYRLSAETGDVDLDVAFPGDTQEVRAVADRHAILTSFSRDRHTGAQKAYSVSTGGFLELDLALIGGVSPDESRVLIGSRCETFPERKLLWRFDAPGPAHAFWSEGDVMMAVGDNLSRGDVARIDAATGEAKWRQLIPRGVYAPGDQLRGGAYAPGDWRPVGMAADHILVVGGDGKILLLDLATGKIQGEALPCEDHMLRPQVVGQNLVSMRRTRPQRSRSRSSSSVRVSAR